MICPYGFTFIGYYITKKLHLQIILAYFRNLVEQSVFDLIPLSVLFHTYTNIQQPHKQPTKALKSKQIFSYFSLFFKNIWGEKIRPMFLQW